MLADATYSLSAALLGLFGVIATIATKENQEEMARKVKIMTKRALEEVARNMRKINAGEGMGADVSASANTEPQNNTLFGQGAPGSTFADNENTANTREFFGFHVDKKTALEFRKFKQKLEKEKKEKVDFNEVLEKLLEIADTNTGKVAQSRQVGRPKPESRAKSRKQKPESRHAPAARYIPVAKTKELNKKHNGCCAYCEFTGGSH